MLISAILAALAGVAYAPPSNEDALAAISSRLAEERYGGDAYKTYGEYPDFVRVDRCEVENAHRVNLDSGYTITLAGQRCILTMAFAAAPAYQVDGFFNYDGVQWVYYGQIYAYRDVGPATFGVQGDKGALAPKRGSILYDGLANVGKTSKPYDKLFTDQDEWLKRPVEQPPQLDPETDEWFRR